MTPPGNYFIIHHQVRHPEWVLARSRARVLVLQAKFQGIRLLLLAEGMNEILALDEIHFTRKLNAEQQVEQLQAFIPQSFLSETDPVRIHLAFDSEIFTLCPEVLFVAEGMADLLIPLAGGDKMGFVTSQYQHHLKARMVHSIPQAWKTWSDQVFSEAECEWNSTISGIIDHSFSFSSQANESILFAHVESGHFYALVFDKGKLLFLNRFEYQTENDLLYFLLLVASETGLQPAGVRCILSGHVLPGSLGFEKLSRYFGALEFARFDTEIIVPSGLELLFHHQYLDLMSMPAYLAAR